MCARWLLGSLGGVMVSGCVGLPPPPPSDEAATFEVTTDPSAETISSLDTTSTSVDISGGGTTTSDTGIDVSSEGTSTGASSTGADSTTDSAIVCGESPSPPPARCDQGCDDCTDGECLMDCLGTQVCDQRMITCPADGPCYVRCGGPQTCQKSIIVCPPSHACRVECGGVEACDQVEIQCGDGPCTVECNTNPNACSLLQLQCGQNDGTITCGVAQTSPPVAVEAPGSTCSCWTSNCES